MACCCGVAWRAAAVVRAWPLPALNRAACGHFYILKACKLVGMHKIYKLPPSLKLPPSFLKLPPFLIRNAGHAQSQSGTWRCALACHHRSALRWAIRCTTCRATARTADRTMHTRVHLTYAEALPQQPMTAAVDGMVLEGRALQHIVGFFDAAQGVARHRRLEWHCASQTP
eukprot:110791-Chlamydomonas_euryale.AAC.1